MIGELEHDHGNKGDPRPECGDVRVGFRMCDQVDGMAGVGAREV